MKIELSKNLIEGMYFYRMLVMDSDRHKHCKHIYLAAISDPLCEFECLDCMEVFKAPLKESDNPFKILSDEIKFMRSFHESNSNRYK